MDTAFLIKANRSSGVWGAHPTIFTFYSSTILLQNPDDFLASQVLRLRDALLISQESSDLTGVLALFSITIFQNNTFFRLFHDQFHDG
jgi:hypothetical protein